MYKHHEDSINNLIGLFKDNPDVLAIVLGGSIAKGRERADSDVDAMIIISERMHAELSSQNRLSEGITEYCTYEGGYFDLKYFTRDYIEKAAEKGSEPTRNSFIGARCIFSRDPEIDEIVRKIPVYPVWDKEDKILSFYSALALNNGFFWGEAEKVGDVYLKVRVASDIVLFGLRMLLAYNEKLFPCQKWLLRIARELEQKPDGVVEKAERFLQRMDRETKDDFVSAVLSFCDWNIPEDFSRVLTRFIEDNEWWWYNRRPCIAEW